MLRNVLIISASGLVLFSKEFANAIAQPRLVGSLLRTMIEFSSKSAGIPVVHIELAHVAVSIVTHEGTGIVCALFYDRGDGAAFGKLVATEVLRAFVTEYGRDVRSVGHNLREFLGFQYRVADVVGATARPLLSQLQAVRGVQKAILISDNSKIMSFVEVDQLSVLANLQAILAVFTDTLDVVGDTPSRMMLEGPGSTRVLMWRFTRATLIVMCHKAVDLSGGESVSRLVHMLERSAIWSVQVGAAR